MADDKWNENDVFYANAFDVGYVEQEVYVDEEPAWFTYTCGPPEGKCQQQDNVEWPVLGELTVDPAHKDVANWAFRYVDKLKPGCYKTQLNRATVISGPPYPTICEDWVGSSRFYVK